MREYTEQYYIPAASAYSERAADKGALSVLMMNWQRDLEKNWPNLRFGEVEVSSDGEKHHFNVQVYINGLDPEAVLVELYADGLNDEGPLREEMTRGKQLEGAHGYIYNAQVSTNRPASDYTARVIPHYSGAKVPLEASHILWQR